MATTFFKSTIAVAVGTMLLTSCVNEELYILPKEDVYLVNSLVESRGLINTEDENSSAINIEVDLAKDTILVENFEALANSGDFLFSDTQEAQIKKEVSGLYQVQKVSFRNYDLESYSQNRRKVTLNFQVDYLYNGEKRDTVLSPWYFQETPVEVIPQEPVDVVTFTTSQTIKNNSKGTVTATLFVNKIVNQQVDTTYKAVVTLARVGEVSGMEVHTVSTACSKENMTCDTLSVSEKVVKDFFYTTTEERLYKWETNFTSTTGGKVSPKNEIKFVLCSKVVFEAEGFKYTWSFNGSANDVVRTIEDKGLEGKEIEGTYSPYLGTYVLKVNAYLFSPQVEELDGSTPFHSSTAENHLYQRESVE
jgi:hypothetical protein